MIQLEALQKHVDEYNSYIELLSKKKKLIDDALLEYEKQNFNGKTFKQYIDKIDEVIEVNSSITIKRTKCIITGEYKVNDKTTIKIVGRTDILDEDFSKIYLVYPDCVRNKLPAKWTLEYNILVSECRKYIIENPAEKLRRDLVTSSISS